MSQCQLQGWLEREKRCRVPANGWDRLGTARPSLLERGRDSSSCLHLATEGALPRLPQQQYTALYPG